MSAAQPAPAGDDHGDDLHLPHGSKWPIMTAFAIAAFGVGGILGGPWIIVGLALVLGTVLGWVSEDYSWWNKKVGTGEPAGRLGIILFMSSEIFIFGALFATYFSFRATADHWPDQHVHLPLLKTGIFSIFLLSSSLTIHRAEKYLKAGNRKGFHFWWGTTILFGAIFLGGQVDEYITLVSEGVGLSTSHFATTFFMITGTHGLHVFGGLVALTIVFVRSLKGQFTPERHLAPQATAMYWHFVDAIWIVVFSVLYLLQ